MLGCKHMPAAAFSSSSARHCRMALFKVARPRAVSYVGQYFIINDNGRITNQRVDPEALGRKLGALSEYEHVDAQ